ncbi:hypothetical protein QQ045_000592 [Rhodiola kirilowii]
MAAFANALGFNNYMDNGIEVSKIWILWRDGISITLKDASYQHITVDVDTGPNAPVYSCTFVYADTGKVARRPLWETLINTSYGMNQPWLVMGDFNVISSWTEKKGGARRGGGAITEFNDFQIHAGLSDAGFSGNKYTWSNNQTEANQIWLRLDRLLVNGPAMAALPELQVQHLARLASDHCPLLISLGDSIRRPSSFKYLHIWHGHADFLDVIKSSWQRTQHDNPILNFALKLQCLRKTLKKWNWEVFGNIKTKLSQLLTRLA